jgi:hypothetical protein
MSSLLSGKKFVTILINQEDREMSSVLTISKSDHFTLEHLKKTNSNYDNIDKGTLKILEEESDFIVAELKQDKKTNHEQFTFHFEFLSPDIGYLKVFQNEKHLTTAFFKREEN